MTPKKTVFYPCLLSFRVKKSFKNYVPSSFLSLIVIGLIFLLLTNMIKPSPLLRKLPVYKYDFKEDNDYRTDKIANILRYFSGILIHWVRMFFVIKAFERNLVFSDSAFIKYS